MSGILTTQISLLGVLILVASIVWATVWATVAVGRKNAKANAAANATSGSLLLKRLDAIEQRLAGIEKTLNDIP